MGYPIYHSQYTAAQIEAAIGKGPRVNQSGFWEVWNVSTGAYESTGVGAGVTPPTVVTQVSQMTNHGYIYIYNGSETGYTAGYWYYWDGSAWTVGGAYQVAATDTTLTVAGAAADAKAAGEKLKNYYGYAFATPIESGTDLNDITTPGVYSINYLIAGTILNSPFASGGQILIVEKTTPADGTIARQTIYQGTTGQAYHRGKGVGSWSAWLDYDAGVNEFLTYRYDTLHTNLVQNSYVDKDTGVVSSFTGRARTPFIYVDGIKNFVCRTTVSTLMNAFYSSDDDTTRISGFGISANTDTIINVPEGAKYVIFSNTDAGMASLSVKFKKTIDKTVESYGNDIATFKSLNSLYEIDRYKIYEPSSQHNESYGGIDYSWLNNTVSVEGTATSDSLSYMFRWVTGNPAAKKAWIQEGNAYYLKLQKSTTDASYFRIRSMINDVIVDQYALSESGVFSFHRVSELTEITIAVFVPNGSNVECTYTYDVLQSPPLQYYMKRREESGVPLNLRIIQNNIGQFRYGRSPGTGDYTHYELTEEEYQTALRNYKKFFGMFNADVVCLQEYVKYGGASNTHDMSEELFKPLYKYYHYNSSITSKQKTIWAKHPCDTQNITFPVGESDNSSFLQAHLLDNDVYIINYAFNSLEDETGVAIRAQQLDGLIAAISDYENVIICCDANVASDTELAYFFTTLTAAGFSAFNMSNYWGSFNTYINPPNQPGTPHFYRKLDGIWCKGNMRMINSQDLFKETTYYPDTYVWDANDVTPEKPNVMVANEYNKLASDHVPVMCDITVY